jgi:predicted amidohydrolase YtcJ
LSRLNRIVAIGSNAEVREFAGSDVQIIDVGGRTIIPGLIDTHMHAARAGQHSRSRRIGTTQRRSASCSIK